ncbi:hypothetical protein [Clostridium algidicarnis]|uniref:hypothetical protein n=1 Tax=Clostridium algidicarnis TaxID=37659 RepID=UPI0009FE67AF|nr:hypothetical protein [Clostridium algidicarnis]MBU3227371.1 hypothetical protein [Clostridium algidicarnis]MBU3251222.1 hypothetical protein [Clostridium algidicarnis]
MSINIKLQDFTATIHQTSKYNGGEFDLVHVESLIVTDQPIPSDDTWYIPNSKPIDPMFKSIFEHAKINLMPTHSSLIQERIDGFGDALNEAMSGDENETKKDITTLALLSAFSKTTLNPIENTENTYLLSYSYKLFPIAPNIFELKVTLPFPGFIMPDNGDEIQITVVTPINAIIDKEKTMGISEDNQQIQPQYAEFTYSRKQAISFQYTTDPEFTIRYNY